MKSEYFDIKSYLQSRNVPYKQSGDNVSSGWIGISCLFCIDHSNHMGINLKTKGFSCFKCAETGNLYKLISNIDGETSIQKIKEIVKEFDGDPYIPKIKQYQSKVKFPPLTTKNFNETHLDYIKSRKYDPEKAISEYDLYVTGPVGEYKHRIIIPVYMKGRIIAFVGRDFTGEAAIPYLNSNDAHSIKDVKSCLYNIDSILSNKAVIVEGIFDAWRIGGNCVATFGTKYTHEQIRLLKGLKRAFILYDSDAIHIAHKLAYDLSSVVPEVEVLELSEGDPDNLTEADVRALRKELKL